MSSPWSRMRLGVPMPLSTSLLMKDKPFKERFRRIAPPLVDEVRQHIQEMLDDSAIRPSQSPLCNAVVLVRKKMGCFGSVSTFVA